jgi:flagellin-like protein
MDKKIRKNKRGVSPVITSIVLVGVVIGMITIIFFWLRSTMVEGIIKLDKNVDLVCQQDVQLNANYDFSTGQLTFANEGNAVIYDIKLRTYSQGTYNVKRMSQIFGTDWNPNGLVKGASLTKNITSYLSYSLGSIEKIQLIPMLLGKNSAKEKKEVDCREEYSITLTRE